MCSPSAFVVHCCDKDFLCVSKVGGQLLTCSMLVLTGNKPKFYLLNHFSVYHMFELQSYLEVLGGLVVGKFGI